MKVRDTAKRIIPKALVRMTKYRAEHDLIKRGPKPGMTDPSIVFFTVHKCASTFLARIIEALNRDCFRLTHIDIDGYATLLGDKEEWRPYHEYIERMKDKIFHPYGYVYGPIRHFVEIENLDKYRICLLLRDPRDVLVSQYYSLAYSHPLPWNRVRRKKFSETRQRIRETDIDTFVLQEMDSLRRRYTSYCETLIEKHGIKPLLYEAMWTNFSGWFKSLVEQLDVKPDPKLISRLEAKSTFPSHWKESANRHRRKGTPGDFRNKLRKDTISILNRKLSDILRKLDYEA